MPFQDQTAFHLSRGVNFRGLTGSVTMQEGEAQDALDVLPREDLSIYQTFGWERINDTALSGQVVAVAGLAYRGKNVDTPSGNTARPGNFGLVDDGAVFTRRQDEFSTKIVLTTTTFYFWNPSTLALETVALPGGVSIDIDGKPTIVVFKENAYIVGWANFNLRFDPTDRALYRWGWEDVPAAPGGATSAGGNLLTNSTYKYAYTYFDVYTGEETGLGGVLEVATTEANRTVDLTFAAYSGSRHFNDLAVATDSDVGIVVYRTDADQEAFYGLATLQPGTLSLSDNGLAVDSSVAPFQRTMQDEPRFYALAEFRGRFYGLSRKEGGSEFGTNRMHYSELTDAPFIERWRVGGYLDLPVTEGDVLTALGATDAAIIVHTRRGGYRVSAVETGETPQHIPTKLPWEAGAVGPRARATRNGWEYWLSERGPYRWAEGLRQPQYIGEPISPQFIDPTSGLCRLTESAKELSEVGFEWYSNTMRFIYSIGGSTTPNMHMAYWVDADRVNGDYRMGWFPQSPKMQAMDLGLPFDQLDETGRPVTGRDASERLFFGDVDGYVYQYDLSFKRGGLKAGALSKGFVVAGSTASSLAVDGGLFTTGDGLTGLRLEVLAADGSVQIRTIESNTDNAIVPTEDFDTTPADGDIYYVGGIPGYWRSWVDHFGDPHMHKTVLHLTVGYLRTGPTAEESGGFEDWRLDLNVGAGEFPTSFDRSRTARLSQYRRRMLVSLTAPFFVYEIANTRPDEMWGITSLQREVQGLPAKRAV